MLTSRILSMMSKYTRATGPQTDFRQDRQIDMSDRMNGSAGNLFAFRSIIATSMGGLLILLASQCAENDAASMGNLSGRGGSLARFAITPTHLYTVDHNNLKVYQFEDNGAVTLVNNVELGPGTETITTRGTELYIGTTQAMLVYDISVPERPLMLSEYNHFVGCDPVVVQDTLAFVTLRTSGCRPSTENTLDIVNIKNPTQPTLVASYNLESPYGLGVDGELLFVCEGENGMKVFNVRDPFNPVMLRNYQDVDAYDVITNQGVLVLTGKQGIVQYDYSDYNNIYQLSTISIQ